MKHSWYERGVQVFSVPTFIGCWIYCAVHYGFLFGVGLGWLPSLIVAGIVGVTWPIIVIAAIVVWLWI